MNIFEEIITRIGEELPHYNSIEYGDLVRHADVVGVIKANAEEYNQSLTNDGWIPCSEDTPQIAGWYLAHVEHKRCAFITIEKVLWKKCKYGSYKWYRKGNDCEVIAWRPLPAPYQPKGE